MPTFPKPIKEVKITKPKWIKRRKLSLEDKIYKKALKEMKRDLKAYKKQLTMPQLKKVVQRKVNEYVRLRDAKSPCLACGKRKDKYDASHYIAQGSSGLLRYDLDNINNTCYTCNRFLHGNLVEYRIGLIKKIGVEAVERLERDRKVIKKWTREELNEILEDTKEMIRVAKI